MADISKITYGNTTWNIKDTPARTNAPKVNLTLSESGVAYFLGTKTSPTSTATLTESVSGNGMSMDTGTGTINAVSYNVADSVKLVFDSDTDALNFVFS